MLGQRYIQRHKDNGPYYRMESHYLLADDMHIGRPIAAIHRIIVGEEAELGQIVQNGIEPNIDHMFVVKIHRHAPLEGAAADAEVLKARKQEVIEHLLGA